MTFNNFVFIVNYYHDIEGVAIYVLVYYYVNYDFYFIIPIALAQFINRIYRFIMKITGHPD